MTSGGPGVPDSQGPKEAEDSNAMLSPLDVYAGREVYQN